MCLWQIASCIGALADVLAKRLPAGSGTKAMRLAYLAALAAPWAAACRQLPPRSRWLLAALRFPIQHQGSGGMQTVCASGCRHHCLDSKAQSFVPVLAFSIDQPLLSFVSAMLQAGCCCLQSSHHSQAGRIMLRPVIAW